MKTITKAQLVEMITNIKGATFATVSLKTYPKPNKTSRITGDPFPFEGLYKTSRYNCTLNFDYEGSVNRQLTREEKEADFEAKEARYNHITRAIVAHKKTGAIHVQFKLEKKLESCYFATNHTGSINETILEEFLQKKYENKSQGTDKNIIVMTPAIDSIIAISLKGEDYVIV